MMHSPELIEKIRKDTESLGVSSLRTPEDVDNYFSENKDFLLFINSMCGCASATARPALKNAVTHLKIPVVTVFAGNDLDATAKAREYLKPYAPSSPSFYFIKGGKAVSAIERHEILHRDPKEVEEKLLKGNQ